jgi:hypothetical protein
MCLMLFGLIFVILVTVWVSWYVVACACLKQQSQTPHMEVYEDPSFGNELETSGSNDAGGTGKPVVVIGDDSPIDQIDNNKKPIGSGKPPSPTLPDQRVYELEIALLSFRVCNDYPNNATINSSTDITLPTMTPDDDESKETAYFNKLTTTIHGRKGITFANYIRTITLDKWILSRRSIVHPMFIHIDCEEFKHYTFETSVASEANKLNCEYLSYKIIADVYKPIYDHLGSKANVLMNVPKDPMEKSSDIPVSACPFDGESNMLTSVSAIGKQVSRAARPMSTIFQMDCNLIMHEVFHNHGLLHAYAFEDVLYKLEAMARAQQPNANKKNVDIAAMSTPIPLTIFAQDIRNQLRNVVRGPMKTVDLEEDEQTVLIHDKEQYFYEAEDPTCIMGYKRSNMLSAPQGRKLGIFTHVKNADLVQPIKSSLMFKVRNVCTKTDNHVRVTTRNGVYYISYKDSTSMNNLGVEYTTHSHLLDKVYVHKEINRWDGKTVFALFDVLAVGKSHNSGMGNLKCRFVRKGNDDKGAHALVTIFPT